MASGVFGKRGGLRSRARRSETPLASVLLGVLFVLVTSGFLMVVAVANRNERAAVDPSGTEQHDGRCVDALADTAPCTHACVPESSYRTSDSAMSVPSATALPPTMAGPTTRQEPQLMETRDLIWLLEHDFDAAVALLAKDATLANVAARIAADLGTAGDLRVRAVLAIREAMKVPDGEGYSHITDVTLWQLLSVDEYALSDDQWDAVENDPNATMLGPHPPDLERLADTVVAQVCDKGLTSFVQRMYGCPTVACVSALTNAVYRAMFREVPDVSLAHTAVRLLLDAHATVEVAQLLLDLEPLILDVTCGWPERRLQARRVAHGITALCRERGMTDGPLAPALEVVAAAIGDWEPTSVFGR